MTEYSLPWAGTSYGDAGPYTDTQWAVLDTILAACAGGEGVAPRFLNGLVTTTTGANTIAVASGGAVVDGKVYYSTAPIPLTIPSAVGLGYTRVDRLVLRCDWALAHVRLHIVSGIDALAPAPPVVTNIPNVTYDIMLYRITVNTSGTVATFDERVMSVQKSFGCRVYNAAGQVITTNTPTICAMPDEAYDLDAMHSPASVNSKVYALQAGKYLVVGEVYWDIDNTGWRRIAIKKNGVTIAAQTINPIITEYTAQSVVTMVVCAWGEYIELEVWHTKGSNLSTVQQILSVSLMGA